MIHATASAAAGRHANLDLDRLRQLEPGELCHQVEFNRSDVAVGAAKELADFGSAAIHGRQPFPLLCRWVCYVVLGCRVFSWPSESAPAFPSGSLVFPCLCRSANGPPCLAERSSLMGIVPPSVSH